MPQLLKCLGVTAIAVVLIACTGEPPRETASADVTPAAAAPGEDVEATITQLEREWVGAIVNKDQTVLERLLADDFVGTSPTAHVYSKPAAIADLANGVYIVDSMTMDEISVNAYGDSVAVAFASQEEKSRYGGTDLSGHYHFTNVWVKRDGRWQAVASHGTRYQTGH